jgi:hypothetical protein
VSPTVRFAGADPDDPRISADVRIRGSKLGFATANPYMWFAKFGDPRGNVAPAASDRPRGDVGG